LEREGKYLRAGEILKYIITDYYSGKKQSPGNNRATPTELFDDNIVYDVRGYTELLAATCDSVTEPFGYMIRMEQNYALYDY
jgi:DNA polymerase, archaea type